MTNRLTSRSFDDGTAELRVEYTYNNRDDVTEVRRYSDAAGSTLVGKTTYTRDDGGRLTAIAHKNSSNTILDDFNYTFDAANRVTQETSTLGPTRNYSYDATNQLLGDGTETFSFDLNGNRTMSGYTTGTGNLITSDGTWDYTHDDEGNLTEKEHISSGELWIYAYNHNNQMTKAEHKASSVSAVDERVEFKYDALHHRIERSYDADGDGAGSATIEKYAIDPHGNPWADLTSAGSLTTRRLYQDALDTAFARIGSSGNEDWLTGDRLGSIRDILDSTGAIINHIDYKSFGGISYESNSANAERLGYAGMEHDRVLNLGYQGERWFSFDIGIWTTQDPIGFAGRLNKLDGYVGNNASNLIDPTGLTGTNPLAQYQQAQEGMWRLRHGSSIGALNHNSQPHLATDTNPRGFHGFQAGHVPTARQMERWSDLVDGFITVAPQSIEQIANTQGLPAAITPVLREAADRQAREFRTLASIAPVLGEVLDILDGNIGGVMFGLGLNFIGGYLIRGLARARRGQVVDALMNGRRGGTVVSEARFAEIQRMMRDEHNVILWIDREGRHLRPGDAAMYRAYENGPSFMYVRPGATEYELFHETLHMFHHQATGSQYFRLHSDPVRAVLIREQYVFDQIIESPFWHFLSRAEQQHAVDYIRRLGGNTRGITP